VVGLSAVLLAGCGSNVTAVGGGGPVAAQSTSVTLLASSTANDSLFEYSTALESLTLTSQSGKTVTVLGSPVYTEFIHLNGVAEPLATANVPQDVYTSATLSISYAYFTCAGAAANGKPTSQGYQSYPSASSVTVSLPSPITVSGGAMGLDLDMMVAASSDAWNCQKADQPGLAATPQLSLTAVDLGSGGSGGSSGVQMHDLEGIVSTTAAGGAGMTVNSVDGSDYGGGSPVGAIDPANGPVWKVGFGSGTMFQGVSGAAQLASGMAVDMDATIQPDGTMVADRVAVYDPNPTQTSLWSDPVLVVSATQPSIYIGERTQVGPFLGGTFAPIDATTPEYAVSDAFSNIGSLPFRAAFTAATAVAGQDVGVTFHAPFSGLMDTNGFEASTMTLMPQTINGTVTASTTSGGFTVYTVALAPSDLFAAMAMATDQTTVLKSPGTIMVYTDANTRMLASKPVAVGGLERFRGLIFNDGGVLRMDCSQINDGVAE
jgi:hypothetical protein